MGTWESTLLPRDINGDGTVDAFYDTVLNISWLADGNAGAGSQFDSDTPTDGLTVWTNAMAWARSLNVYGTTGWRLPTVVDTGYVCANVGTSCGYNVQILSADGRTVYSEWAHLFYVTLGNLAYCDVNGDCNLGRGEPDFMLQNTGNFRNLQTWPYWTGSTVAQSPDVAAWIFDTRFGYQDGDVQGDVYYALAVRPGDVTAAAQVPEPQTALLALGAMLLAGGRRRPKGTSAP